MRKNADNFEILKLNMLNIYLPIYQYTISMVTIYSNNNQLVS